MEQNQSAITQMLTGERENFDCIRPSEECRKAQIKTFDKTIELENMSNKFFLHNNVQFNNFTQNHVILY